MPVNQSDLEFFKIAQTIMQEAMTTLSGPPTIDDIRKTTVKFKSLVSKEPLLPFENIQIPLPDGSKVKARYIRKYQAQKPLLIFFPGTGYMHPIFDENYTVLSRMIKQLDCQGIMLENRLSPEHPFPCPHIDAKALIDYILNNATAMGIMLDKVILSGHSSGGNMAAVLANTLQFNSDFKPFHLYLLSGGFDYTDSLHDYDDFVAQDKMLDKASQAMSFDLFCQNANRRDPGCSPYWQQDFSMLCPTTIQCGEYDGGRSQSEGYAKKLLEHHVNLEKIIVPGQTHLSILYRGACSDGEDPALIAAKRIQKLLSL